MTGRPVRLYGDSRSGNCYKLKLLCAEMDIGYEWREVDILAGDTRTPEFLAMNPNGKVPLMAASVAFGCGSDAPRAPSAAGSRSS